MCTQTLNKAINVWICVHVIKSLPSTVQWFRSLSSFPLFKDCKLFLFSFVLACLLIPLPYVFLTSLSAHLDIALSEHYSIFSFTDSIFSCDPNPSILQGLVELPKLDKKKKAYILIKCLFTLSVIVKVFTVPPWRVFHYTEEDCWKRVKTQDKFKEKSAQSFVRVGQTEQC